MTLSTKAGPLFALVCVAASLCFGCRSTTVRAESEGIPSAVVLEGNLQLRVSTTGTLNSTNAQIVSAPPVAGGTLQILSLKRTGSAVRKGEVVLAFDPSQQDFNLAQARSDLAQAEQEIVKAQADAAVQTAQDKTAMLKAKFAVRRAELDVSKNELVSEIDAKKNQLALDEARRALAQLEQDVQSHASSNQAGIALSEEKRNKARLAMQQALENIQKMQIRAPIDGMIVIHGNQSACGDFCFDESSIPDYQPGDQASPGSTIADIVDINQMEIAAQVEESDRPFLKTGQKATISVDALSRQEFPGQISNVAGAANREFWESDAHRKFDIKVKFDAADPRFRPGFTAHMILLGEDFNRVTYIPREAIFRKDGKTIVFAKESGNWIARDVKVRAYTEGRAVVENLGTGTVVALLDPEKQSKKPKSSGPGGPSLSGGAL